MLQSRYRNIVHVPSQFCQLKKTQSQCVFLRNLPLEIREEIYKYVVGEDLVHIVRKGRELAHVRCKFDWPWDVVRKCWCAAAHTCYDEASQLASTANGNAALLRTCSQIYIEAVSLIYSNNAFDFDNQDIFLFFSRSVLPQRLAQIRRLKLNLKVMDIEHTFPWIEAAPNGWSLMWLIIGRDMPGLKHLRVELVGLHGSPCPDMDADWWLQSLLQVRNLETFHLGYRASANYWTDFEDGVFETSKLLEGHIRSIVCSDP